MLNSKKQLENDMWLIALMACSTSEYRLNSVSQSTASPADAAVAAQQAAQPPTVMELSSGQFPTSQEGWRPQRVPTDSSAVEVWEHRDSPHLVEVHEVGSQTRAPMMDFLFVVDSSSSMRSVVEELERGFQQLSDTKGLFPRNTRVAVTNMIADLDYSQAEEVITSPSQLKLVQHYFNGHYLEPGANRLVSDSSIKRARQVLSDKKSQYFEGAGCSSWFSPTEKTSSQVPCLTSHMRIAEGGIGAEPGFLALQQLLEPPTKHKMSRHPLTFRPGASVNIVFVSDTQSPGIGGELGDWLLEKELPVDELTTIIGSQEEFSSVRFHAIAPDRACSKFEDWEAYGFEAKYQQAAQKTGGETLDICSAAPQDYVEFLKRVINNGPKQQQPVITLSAPISSIRDVQVNGAPVAYSAAKNSRTLLLDIPLAAQQRVRVRLRKNTDKVKRVRRK